MLPRLVRLAYVLGVIVPAVLALQVFLAYDELEGSGASFQIVVQEISAAGRLSAADLDPALHEVALSTGSDIGRIEFDLTDPSHIKRLFVVLGHEDGEAAHRLAAGFRHFSPEIDEEYRAFADIGEVDPRGYYVVWGEHADAEAFLVAMERVGLVGAIAPYPGSVGDLATDGLVFLGPAVVTATAVSILALMVMVGGGVVMSAQAYGVQRLQGRSFGDAVRRDLAEVGRLLAVTLCVVTPLGGVALWFYNQGARVGELGVTVAVAVAVVLGVIVLTHVTAAGLAFRVPILAAVKGQFSAGWALVGILGVRVVGVLLAASVAFATVQAALQVADRSAAQARWSSDPGAVYVMISGQMGGDDPAVEARYAAMAHTAVDSGDAVLVDDITQDLAETEPLTGFRQGPSPVPCPALLVSEDYLSRQPVLETSGARLTAVAGGSVTVLAPTRCQDFARREVPKAVVGTGAGMGDPSFVFREIAADQAQFTYGTVNKLWDAALQHDAVLVVLPPDVDVLPDAFYGSYLTQGNVVFDDAETAERYVTEYEVEPIVVGIWSAREDAAAQYGEVVSNLRISLLSLAVALVVMVVTAVSVSAVHVRRSAQLVYVRYITGWPAWYSHRFVLVLELLLAMLVVGAGAALGQQGGRFEAAVFAGQASHWRLGIAVAVAVLAAGSVLLGLRWATARLIATRSSDS